MGWLEKTLFILLQIGAILISVLICSFFVVLASYKKEVWKKIKFKEGENERQRKRN